MSGTLPASTRIILLRHGESDFNLRGLIQGRSDTAQLTDRGEQMARQAGRALQGLALDALYVSPLGRARATAAGLLEALGGTQAIPSPEIHPDLREIDLPAWEGLTQKGVREQFPEAFAQWRYDPEAFTMAVPGEASLRRPVMDLFAQAHRFWETVLARHPGQTILVVGHATINRVLLVTALGMPPAAYFRLQQSNCGLTVLRLASGRPAQLESLNLTAHLDQPFPPVRNDSLGPRLVLVRHGETDWNRIGRFQGIQDIPLNTTGQAQAGRAAQFLQSVPFDFAVSSPLQRSWATAEAILQHHPHLMLKPVPDLQEISHGLWEGHSHAEVEATFPGMLATWNTSPEQVQMPQGENLAQVWERAGRAWDALVAAHPGQTGLVVAHDAINKAILCRVLDLGPEAFWRIKQGNGSVTVVDYPEGAGRPAVIQSLNVTTHLSAGILDQTAAGAL